MVVDVIRCQMSGDTLVQVLRTEANEDEVSRDRVATSLNFCVI